ncbi:hypothetical protein [Paenibacillus herberti]|uniref:Zinc-finger domain-containing protein n=1 Tax=Paenibacillus herberti TaxID=1619309 RepID=A0A229P0S4_9BACL|nr:hypothetical protein [Paenibacillus herberti]OXM15535.1 hypothetical protein CGZ75_02010 [Paenibacillus herberti]
MSEINHPSSEVWINYVSGSIAAELERATLERHLANCASCLELYIAALDTAESALAPVSASTLASKSSSLGDGNSYSEGTDPSNLMDRPADFLPPANSMTRIREAVLQQLKADSAAHQKRRRAWARHPAFHYGLAAALTLMLLLTGALSGLTRELEKDISSRTSVIGSNPTVRHPAADSWSGHVVERTSKLLDEWESVRYR